MDGRGLFIDCRVRLYAPNKINCVIDFDLSRKIFNYNFLVTNYLQIVEIKIFINYNVDCIGDSKRGNFLYMNANSDKVLLPNDVRRLLNVDNREIVELCKKTSVNPKKDSKGQIYFSVDEVRKLKNAKSSIVAELVDKKSALSAWRRYCS